MEKIALGICLFEKEYEKRFCAIIMNYYRSKVNLYIYSSMEEIAENQLSSLVIDDYETAIMMQRRLKIPIICLTEKGINSEIEGVICVDKYMEVSSIMSEIIQQIGGEITEIFEGGTYTPKTSLIGVYGLSESEFQLPLVLTLADILGESERVLVLDLQENSGLDVYERPKDCLCLEDLFLMVKSGNCKREHMQRAIGKHNRMEYVYPVVNTEVLSELERREMLLLVDLLKESFDYKVIIINLGSRFQGFFELLNQCSQIYMLQNRGGLGKWREYEFIEEICKRGYNRLVDKLVKIEVPLITQNFLTCREIAEQWRWDEFGDNLRKLSFREAEIG